LAGRVALVVASSTGGTGRHVASLAEGLVAGGAAVTVFGPAATERRFGFTGVGAAFVPVEIPAAPGPADVVAVRALRAALRRGAADHAVVHAHGLRAGLVAAMARPAGVPLLVTWHNLVLARGARGTIYRGLERFVARAADVTFVVSADLAARARALGATDVRLAAVPAPPLAEATRSPGEVRAELGVEPGRPLVLSVGRLHPQKGHDVLIDAAAQWRDLPRVPLVAIAGDGPSRADLADRIAATGAPVRLLGPRGDIADLLAAADIVVATSVWEGQPLLVQETLRAGAPLVATAVGGVPDVAGDAALLIGAGDVAAVDAAVRRLLHDDALRERYARRGPEQAATWPDEAEATALVVSTYAELLARRPAAGRRG
jgi:glycosyltransferase involved in cell wall biosynthesis